MKVIAKTILKDVKKEIEKHNIELKIVKGYRLIYDSEKCYGYFEPPLKTKRGKLALAIGDKRHVDYLWDLAHELAHFRQWRREDPVFVKHQEDDSVYPVLERKTEKEAQKIFENWGLNTSKRLKKRSKKYLSQIS
jgi:hypothetical protein